MLPQLPPTWDGMIREIGISDFATKTTQENASSMVSISGRFNDRSPCPVEFDNGFQKWLASPETMKFFPFLFSANTQKDFGLAFWETNQ